MDDTPSCPLLVVVDTTTNPKMTKEMKVIVDKKHFLTVPDIVEHPEENGQSPGENGHTFFPPNSELPDSDLTKLKAMTTRLNLSTKRPSYIEWRAKFMDKPDLIRTLSNGLSADAITDKPWTKQTVQDVDQALAWLKNELIAMRGEDQAIARRLITIRQEIHELKLEWSCDEHKMVLEEAREELDEDDLLAELCDSPLDIGPLSPMAPFKELGITRMNISRRRFSVM
ncbi:protein FAM167A-like [Lineus longissimus]|uniref:protein FAM167A-like n=1 Tax=Lineus longissimus TaxID=88925 RepID=UPI00315C9C3B